jgi:hypothetical protein
MWRPHVSSASASDGTIEPSAVSYFSYSDRDIHAAVGHLPEHHATDTGVLVLSAMALVALHTAINGQYGFHRDELATIDDARFLSWGTWYTRRLLPSSRECR